MGLVALESCVSPLSFPRGLSLCLLHCHRRFRGNVPKRDNGPLEKWIPALGSTSQDVHQPIRDGTCRIWQYNPGSLIQRA